MCPANVVSVETGFANGTLSVGTAAVTLVMHMRWLLQHAGSVAMCVNCACEQLNAGLQCAHVAVGLAADRTALPRRVAAVGPPSVSPSVCIPPPTFSSPRCCCQNGGARRSLRRLTALYCCLQRMLVMRCCSAHSGCFLAAG